MAIQLVPFPAAAPTSIDDWEDIINITETLLLNTNVPVKYDFSSNTIKKGIVINIGGSVYIATSDTAITGTPSDYVKITPSGVTAAAAYVANLTGVTWSDVYSHYEDVSGNAYLFDEAKAFSHGEISIPSTLIGRFAEKGWMKELSFETESSNPPNDITIVGNELNIPLASNIQVGLVGLTEDAIAWIDEDNAELRHYAFDGSDWTLTGSGFSLAGIDNPSIAVLGPARVAVFGGGIDELRIYDFDGSVWSLVGSGFSIAGSTSVTKMSSLSSTEIALFLSSVNTLTKYSFNGSVWSKIGNDTSVTGGLVGMVALSSNNLIMKRGSADPIEQYVHDGSDWVLSGVTSTTVSFTASTIAALGANLMIMGDGGSGGLRIYGRGGNSGSWDEILNVTQLPGALAIYVSALSRTRVVVYNYASTEENLATYEIQFGDKPPSPAFN